MGYGGAAPVHLEIGEDCHNLLAWSGRPGQARVSQISLDWDGSYRVLPVVSRGLVVKVTQDRRGQVILFWLLRYHRP